jgi:hypothetical protein
MAMLFQFNLDGQTYGLSTAKRHFYVLDDGSLLPVRVWPAWCERCRTFTASEQIFPIADELNELKEVEYFAERPGLIPPDRRFSIGELPNLRLRKNWRDKRRSTPKCLDCGSVDITSIWPGPEVDIPGRGKCVARFIGWGDVSGPPNAYYSPEGEIVQFQPARQRPSCAT